MNYRPPREAARANLAIDRAAREAGRDPARFDASTTFPARSRERSGPATDTDQSIVGPPEHWAEVLTHFASRSGFSTFMLAAPPDPDTLTAFIEDVAPMVRDRVAEQRASAAGGSQEHDGAPSSRRPPETARGRWLHQRCSPSTRTSAASSRASSARDGRPRRARVEELDEEARGAEEQHHALAVPGQLPALLPARPLAPQRRRHETSSTSSSRRTPRSGRSSSDSEPIIELSPTIWTRSKPPPKH